MRCRRIIRGCVIALLLCLIIGGTVSAGPFDTVAGSGSALKKAYNVIKVIAIPLATISIVIGAFKFFGFNILAPKNQERRLEEGRRQIVVSIIALCCIFFVPTVVKFAYDNIQAYKWSSVDGNSHLSFGGSGVQFSGGGVEEVQGDFLIQKIQTYPNEHNGFSLATSQQDNLAQKYSDELREALEYWCNEYADTLQEFIETGDASVFGGFTGIMMNQASEIIADKAISLYAAATHNLIEVNSTGKFERYFPIAFASKRSTSKFFEEMLSYGYGWRTIPWIALPVSLYIEGAWDDDYIWTDPVAVWQQGQVQAQAMEATAWNVAESSGNYTFDVICRTKKAVQDMGLPVAASFDLNFWYQGGAVPTYTYCTPYTAGNFGAATEKKTVDVTMNVLTAVTNPEVSMQYPDMTVGWDASGASSATFDEIMEYTWKDYNAVNSTAFTAEDFWGYFTDPAKHWSWLVKSESGGKKEYWNSYDEIPADIKASIETAENAKEFYKYYIGYKWELIHGGRYVSTSNTIRKCNRGRIMVYLDPMADRCKEAGLPTYSYTDIQVANPIAGDYAKTVVEACQQANINSIQSGGNAYNYDGQFYQVLIEVKTNGSADYGAPAATMKIRLWIPTDWAS